MIDKTYLPFSEAILKKYFLENKKGTSQQKHAMKFINSAKNYSTNLKSQSSKIKNQIQKDETFWTASTLITIFESPNRNKELIQLLKIAFGDIPPLKDFNSWEECFEEKPKQNKEEKEDYLKMYFETNYPSPTDYLEWLKTNIDKQTFIPYMSEQAKINIQKNRHLEGPTNVDCIFINTTNGFSVMIEAKVLSDISYAVTYDCQRNQLIRNVDIMLEEYTKLHIDLNKKDSNNTLFMLLTPKKFKDQPHSRLYGFMYNEYKNSISSIQADLLHRNLDIEQAKDISNRIGWITWEDFKHTNSNCCKWL